MDLELTEEERNVIIKRRSSLKKLGDLQREEGGADLNDIRVDSSPEEKARARKAIARALAESGY